MKTSFNDLILLSGILNLGKATAAIKSATHVMIFLKKAFLHARACNHHISLRILAPLPLRR
jgi:hypothetical protein